MALYAACSWRELNPQASRFERDGFASLPTRAGYLTRFRRGFLRFAAALALRVEAARIAPAALAETPCCLAILDCTALKPGCLVAIASQRGFEPLIQGFVGSVPVHRLRVDRGYCRIYTCPTPAHAESDSDPLLATTADPNRAVTMTHPERKVEDSNPNPKESHRLAGGPTPTGSLPSMVPPEGIEPHSTTAPGLQPVQCPSTDSVGKRLGGWPRGSDRQPPVRTVGIGPTSTILSGWRPRPVDLIRKCRAPLGCIVASHLEELPAVAIRATLHVLLQNYVNLLQEQVDTLCGPYLLLRPFVR